MNNQQVEYRYILHCETATPLHLGSGQPGALTDAELRKNSKGELTIPGTSIAGTVRRTLERLAGVDHYDADEPPADRGCLLYNQQQTEVEKQHMEFPCQCNVCEFMGNVNPRTVSGEVKTKWEEQNKPPLKVATQSQVRFHDVRVEDAPNRAKTRVVDSVAMNRQRRAASDAKKFDYAQVLPGWPLQFEVRAENLNRQQQQWLGAALKMLVSGEIRIGGKSNRGHGALKVTDENKGQCKIFKRDLKAVDQLLAAVVNADDGSPAWASRPVADSLDTFPGSELKLNDRITVSFKIKSAGNSTLLINDPVAQARSGFDHAMRRFPTDYRAAQRDAAPHDVEVEQGRIEFPVSSFVGALRSGAERIARTITQPRGFPGDKNCHCDLLADHCTKNNHDANPCLMCQLFGNPDYASRLSATVETKQSGYEVPFDHVAIDRFTGGAADRKKFDAQAVYGAEFGITLMLENVKEENARWMIGLLVLAIGDLHDGRIWLGHGSARGHGLMEVTDRPAWNTPDGWPEPDSAYLQQCVDALWEKLNIQKPSAEAAR